MRFMYAADTGKPTENILYTRYTCGSRLFIKAFPFEKQMCTDGAQDKVPIEALIPRTPITPNTVTCSCLA
jgi:hypothetical protein